MACDCLQSRDHMARNVGNMQVVKHLSLYGIQAVLIPEVCGPHGDGHSHVAGWCCLSLPDICSWSWYTGFEVFDNSGLHCLCKYVIWSSEVHSLDVREHSQHHFMLDLFTFVWSGWGGVLPLHACFYTCGFKIITLCLIAYHSLSQKHVHNVPLWMFEHYWHCSAVCVCH